MHCFQFPTEFFQFSCANSKIRRSIVLRFCVWKLAVYLRALQFSPCEIPCFHPVNCGVRLFGAATSWGIFENLIMPMGDDFRSNRWSPIGVWKMFSHRACLRPRLRIRCSHPTTSPVEAKAIGRKSASTQRPLRWYCAMNDQGGSTHAGGAAHPTNSR